MKHQLTDALLSALNAAADTILSSDPDGRRRLAQLQGKVLCIEVTAPPLVLYVLPAVTGIEFRRDLGDDGDGGGDGHGRGDNQADVTISGSALALANLATGRRGASNATGNATNAKAKHANGAHEKHRVTVRGDAEVGQAFRKIIAELDLDWEELLARNIGDTPARKLGNALRGLGDWAEQSFAFARENAADYLSEEKQTLATDAAARRFERQVDQTRADVDRLAQRVQRIKRAIDGRDGARDRDQSRDQNRDQNRGRN